MGMNLPDKLVVINMLEFYNPEDGDSSDWGSSQGSSQDPSPTTDQRWDLAVALAAKLQPTFIVDSRNVPTSDDCSVCLAEFVDGEKLVRLNCNHEMHFLC